MSHHETAKLPHSTTVEKNFAGKLSFIRHIFRLLHTGQVWKARVISKQTNKLNKTVEAQILWGVEGGHRYRNGFVRVCLDCDIL